MEALCDGGIDCVVEALHYMLEALIAWWRYCVIETLCDGGIDCVVEVLHCVLEALHCVMKALIT